MNSHTPGPWAIEGGGNIVSRSPNARFYDLAKVFHFMDESGEIDANTRLISAAPELLAACEGIAAADFEAAHDTIEFGPGGTTEEFEAQALIDSRMAAVRAAIQKARGEA